MTRYFSAALAVVWCALLLQSARAENSTLDLSTFNITVFPYHHSSSALAASPPATESVICKSLDALVTKLNSALSSMGGGVKCETHGALAAKLTMDITLRVGTYSEQFGFYIDVKLCNDPPAMTFGVNIDRAETDFYTVKYGEEIDEPIPGLSLAPGIGIDLTGKLEGSLKDTHLKLGLSAKVPLLPPYTLWLTGEDGIDVAIDFNGCPTCPKLYALIGSKLTFLNLTGTPCAGIVAIVAAPFVAILAIVITVSVIQKRRQAAAAQARLAPTHPARDALLVSPEPEVPGYAAIHFGAPKVQ